MLWLSFVRNVVAVLCIVNTGPMLIAVSITELLIIYLIVGFLNTVHVQEGDELIGYCAWQHSHLPSFSWTGEDHLQNCTIFLIQLTLFCLCKQKQTRIDMELPIISF